MTIPSNVCQICVHTYFPNNLWPSNVFSLLCNVVSSHLSALVYFWLGFVHCACCSSGFFFLISSRLSLYQTASEQSHDYMADESMDYDDLIDSDYVPVEPHFVPVAHYNDESRDPFPVVTRKKEKKHRKRLRVRVRDEWDSEEIVNLISAVKERPALWDQSHAEHKQPSAFAWREVADVMATKSPDECKAKWTNLRVSFTINLAKHYRTQNEILWPYFQHMQFLRPAIVRRSIA